MRRLTLILMAILVAGCSAQAAPATAPATAIPRAKGVDYYVRVYGGLAGVYRSVLGESDCGALQELFYTATDNETVGYQAVIDDRSHDLGCPELRFTRP